MKNVVIAFSLSLFSIGAFAQSPDLDTKWANMMVETERTLLFEQAMGLEGEKKVTFDALYKEYEAELETIRQSYMTDLKKYAEMYVTLTDEQANELVASSYKRQASRMKLQKKYHKLIAKTVDGKSAARFVQLDDAISMALRLSVMDEIPFVGDM